MLEFFNRRPRNCLLVTSDGKGKVDAAVYGSPRMIDEETVVLASREGRSYRYLRENPEAALVVVEPGEMSRSSKGVRVYMRLTAIETEGDLLNKFREELSARVGKESAAAMRAAMRFKITEVRGLVE